MVSAANWQADDPGSIPAEDKTFFGGITSSKQNITFSFELN